MAVASLEVRYRAATEAAALLDRSERGKLALSGSQAAEFLDSLLSNDIASIETGHGASAALLTHKGRLLADVRVLRSVDELELDCERAALQALFDALSGYRIGYDAELHKRTLQRGLLSLIGPGGDALLDRAPGTVEHDHVEAAIDGRAVRLIRTDVGIDVLCTSEDSEAIAAALVASGAEPIDEQTAEIVRIESGRPRFGVELDETTMPQEAGIHERAVSYSKGCYIGQETVARLYWKGKPNRHLRGLRFAGPAERGATLALAGREVGAVGSVAQSPRLGTIGLALLRREAEPGAALEVSGGGSAIVSDLPFER
ncbi:MAG TPA: folate-binding protein [Solirubrobacteraceae bacterium]|nr:folate-binding protein [Solirubrobacteraceae bacterium]